MYQRQLKARAERQFVTDGIVIHLYETTEDGKISIMTDAIFETFDPTQFIEPDKALVVPYQTAQELMDSLWDCGLRPSEGSGSAGALKAVENHLKDLQEYGKRLLTIVERKE